MSDSETPRGPRPSSEGPGGGMPRRRFVEILGGGALGSLALTNGGILTRLDTAELERLADAVQAPELERVFRNPPDAAGLWVVWHWMNANVTREGLTRDLEEMAAAGIRNPCMFSIGVRNENTTVVETPADPLSPYWWDLVRHAIAECDRLGMTMAMQICDGWAAAGGPAITPELSMQRVVWSEVPVEGGRRFDGVIPPAPPDTAPTRGGGPGNPKLGEILAAARAYYKDIALLAYRVPNGWGETNASRRAAVTTTLPLAAGAAADALGSVSGAEATVDTDQPGHVQFAFAEPFTLRSVTVRSPGAGAANIPANRLDVQVSDDGAAFRTVHRLDVMLGGWQTNVNPLTHSVPETTARVFRFVYTPGPVLPYDEQMTGASRAPDNNRLRLSGLALSSTAVVHHLPGKSARVWGKSRRMTNADAPPHASVSLDAVVDLTDRLRPDGAVTWDAPDGEWRLLRLGHRSTLVTNNPAGAGQGLEADKFNPAAARVQFDSWFGEALRQAGPAKAGKTLKVLNIDSWECYSQNWSPVFRAEFRTRRGYDLLKYLPAMAGIPVQDGETTERFLLDVRTTIGELVEDNFFKPTAALARQHGCIVAAETTAPTFPGDGMLHYQSADVPTGEFWSNVFLNWKPLDVKEAVSTARVYGKPVAMTESFTGGGTWTEHPGALKALGDHNFAEGINRFMLHLWGMQAFPDRYPGIPGSAGTQFNYHQTWWKPGRAWFEYLRRSQALLQQGRAVCDAAYYTGEDVPRRALLEPDKGTTFVIDPPLPPGYRFDSVNRDALLRLARVERGRVVFPSGASYRVLVLPDDRLMTPEVAEALAALVAAGAAIVGPPPVRSPSLRGQPSADRRVQQLARELWGDLDGTSRTERRVGQGRVFWGKPMAEVLAALGATPDVTVAPLLETATGRPVRVERGPRWNPTAIGKDRAGGGVQWIHRQGAGWDLYFVSNQEPVAVTTELSFRVAGRVPEYWYPDTGKIEEVAQWRPEGGRTAIPMRLDPAGSVFVIFRGAGGAADPVVDVGGAAVTAGPGWVPNATRLERTAGGLVAWAAQPVELTVRTRSGQRVPLRVADVPAAIAVDGPWEVRFAPPGRGATKSLRMARLASWPTFDDPDVKFFSGTATYAAQVGVPAPTLGSGRRLLLDLGDVQNLARVRVNGRDLGVLWKAPFVVDVTPAVKAGENTLEVEVTNTWRNRLVGDSGKPAAERQTWVLGNITMSPTTPLLPAGLLGPVRLVTEVRIAPVRAPGAR
jgi:hypothetical protein